MNLDDLLTRSARDIASDLPVPQAPDPQALGARAVSLRRRRRLGVTAMASAAALVGVAILVPAMSALRSAEPVDEPPPDRLGNVPAWADAEGSLHIGDDVIETGTEGHPFALTARGVVWKETETPHLYWQSLDGERVELTSEATQLFTSDPLGDLVVWVTRDFQMVTYDVGAERIVDSRLVRLMGSTVGAEQEPPVMIGPEPPVLFVSDNEVVYEAAGDVWALDIQAGKVTQMPGVSAKDLLDHGPNGSVVAVTSRRDGLGGGGDLALLEFRGPSGTVRAERGRLFREGRLSPDGRWCVTSTGYHEGLRTVVLDTTTGRQVPVDFPDKMRGGRYSPWGWSGTDVLMLGLYDKEPQDGGVTERVWACRLADGTCERVREAVLSYPL